MMPIEDLKTLAGLYCIDIYNDFDEVEIKTYSPAIQKAWEIGRDLFNS